MSYRKHEKKSKKALYLTLGNKLSWLLRDSNVRIVKGMQVNSLRTQVDGKP
jgi:hypothetical protein